MQQSLITHYRSFSSFTYPGLYQERLRRDLPADIRQAGHLLRLQMIHKGTLYAGRARTDTRTRYGDMSKVPWYRQSEDDYFPTATAMLAELYRRDARGFVLDRAEEHKLILTCRFVAIMMASILKSRGIPARVRAGYAPYIPSDQIETHWITQYWDDSHARWVTIDVDTSLEDRPFDPFDMPPGVFDFAATAWLTMRAGHKEATAYSTHEGQHPLHALATQVITDFHYLMNNEITYTHIPAFIASGFEDTNEPQLQEVDALAHLLLRPEENFTRLQDIWETNRGFRLLRGSLI
ncbi:transglutaminase domain-containing protein [Dictyobacter aurantiacus]|nr:transglutaminase domain-containing protein [Dictyobacter aurantiacus]